MLKSRLIRTLKKHSPRRTRVIHFSRSVWRLSPRTPTVHSLSHKIHRYYSHKCRNSMNVSLVTRRGTSPRRLKDTLRPSSATPVCVGQSVLTNQNDFVYLPPAHPKRFPTPMHKCFYIQRSRFSSSPPSLLHTIDDVQRMPRFTKIVPQLTASSWSSAW